MRTTLDIDDPVLRELKRAPGERGEVAGPARVRSSCASTEGECSVHSRFSSDLDRQADGGSGEPFRQGGGVSCPGPVTPEASNDHHELLPGRQPTPLLVGHLQSVPRRSQELSGILLSRHDILYLSWPTIMGYLRIATHPSIFDEPLTPEEAMANVETLLNLPQCRCLAEEDGFWETWRATTGEVSVHGNLGAGCPSCRASSLPRGAEALHP